MVICGTLGVRLENPLFVGATKGLRNPQNYTQTSLSSQQEHKAPLRIKKYTNKGFEFS